MQAGSLRPLKSSWTASPSGPQIKGGRQGPRCGKKIWGRKRHILTDTDGRLFAVHVHSGDVQDRNGAKGLLKRSRARYPFVKHALLHLD